MFNDTWTLFFMYIEGNLSVYTIASFSNMNGLLYVPVLILLKKKKNMLWHFTFLRHAIDNSF